MGELTVMSRIANRALDILQCERGVGGGSGHERADNVGSHIEAFAEPAV